MGEAGSETERRINAFAVHLLLPRSSLTTAWNASSEGIRTRAIRLAAEYRVSWSALCAQLKNLGLVREPERQMLLEQRPLPRIPRMGAEERTAAVEHRTAGSGCGWGGLCNYALVMLTREREIVVPTDLCLPDGRLNPEAVGWTRRPLHRANLRGWGRAKRWEYWGIVTPGM
nr:hypothetical protein GCM10020093_054000 [Planobispora longispora]